MLRQDGLRGQAGIIGFFQQAFPEAGVSRFRDIRHIFTVVIRHFPDAFHLTGDAVHGSHPDFIGRTHPDIYSQPDEPGTFSFILRQNGGAACGPGISQRGLGRRDRFLPGNIIFRRLRISGYGVSHGIGIRDAVRIHLCVRQHVMQPAQRISRYFAVYRIMNPREGREQVICVVWFRPFGNRAFHFQGFVRIRVFKGDGIGAEHDILREQVEIPVCRAVFAAAPEPAVQDIGIPVRRIQGIPEFSLQRGERVCFRLLIGHVALAGQVGRIFLIEADIRQQLFEPVLLLQRPGTVIAPESLTADFHDGFFLIVSLTALQDLHQGVVFLQGKAVFIERLNQMRQLFRRIILIRDDARVVFQGHGDGHLFHNFLLAQQHRGNGDGRNQHQHQREHQAGFHFMFHDFSSNRVLIQLIALPGGGMDMGQLFVQCLLDPLLHDFITHAIHPFPARFSGGLPLSGAGGGWRLQKAPAPTRFPGL